MAKIVASKFGNRQLVHLPPVKVSPERADIHVPTLDPKEHYVRDTPSHHSESDRSVRGYVVPRRPYTHTSDDDGRRSASQMPREHGNGNLARGNPAPIQTRDEPTPPLRNDSLIEGQYRIVPQTDNPAGNHMQYTQHALAQMTQDMQQQMYTAQAPRPEYPVQYTAQGPGGNTPSPGQYAQPQPGQYAQPQPGQYAQPQPGQYAQPQQGQYAQPQQGQYAQTDHVVNQQQPYVQPSPAQYALQNSIAQHDGSVNKQIMSSPYVPVQQPQEGFAFAGSNPNEKHIFYGPNGEILQGPPPGFNLDGSKPRNVEDYPRDFAIDGVCENGTLRSIKLLHGTATFPKIPDSLQASLRQKYKDFTKTDIRIVCRNGEYHVHAVPDIGDSQLPLPPAIVVIGSDPYFMPDQDPPVSRTYGSPPQLERSYPFADRGDAMAPFRWKMSRAESRPETNRATRPLPAAMTPALTQTPAANRMYSMTPDARRRPDTTLTQQTLPATRDIWRPTPDVHR